MDRIFLLRAFGDFVIALQAISKADKKVKVIASAHLMLLYQALVETKSLDPISIEFIDLGMQYGQLNFFTNKQLFSLDTIKQLNRLKAFLKANPNQQGVDYIEQAIRLRPLNFILGSAFKAVVPKRANVYEAYAQWLGKAKQEQIHLIQDSREVILFPDARLKKKVISDKFLSELVKKKEIQGHYSIARFNNLNQQELSYNNFESLISLIHSASYIFTADSLPAHIAQLVGVPHSIVYSYKGVNRFCTPFALQNKTFIELND